MVGPIIKKGLVLNQKIIGVNSQGFSHLYLEARKYERKVIEGPICFVPIDLAYYWTGEWIKTFPKKYDLIVGVPRSGLLIANIIASKLGSALTTPDSLSNERYWCPNHTDNLLKSFDNILIVEDATSSGNSIKDAKNSVLAALPNASITTASLIIPKDVGFRSYSPLVDIWYVKLKNVLTEWTLMHHKPHETILGIDMDGVICIDCPSHYYDGGPAYEEWLTLANPYLIPNYEIDMIITNRLEGYRPQTESWLRKHGVTYKKLLMADSLKARDNHKVKSIMENKPDLFIESSNRQAQDIFRRTAISVICTDIMKIYQ